MIPDETKNKVFSIEKRWVFVAFFSHRFGKTYNTYGKTFWPLQMSTTAYSDNRRYLVL